MSDIEKFISERKAKSPKAWADFEHKYQAYAIGALLAEQRTKAGLTLGEIAKRTKMQKAALSRLEHPGKDVRLSTITRYVEATGLAFKLTIAPSLPAGPTTLGANRRPVPATRARSNG